MLERICTVCKFQAPLSGWTEAGTVERYTPEMQSLRAATLMHSWGLGQKPVKERKKILQKIKEFWLGTKPVDPSEQYTEIKIADTIN